MLGNLHTDKSVPVGTFSCSPRPAGYKHVTNAPGKPSLQMSREGIDFGDKIGFESVCVCVLLIRHVASGSSRFDSPHLSFFSCGKKKKNKNAFNENIRDNIYKL